MPILWEWYFFNELSQFKIYYIKSLFKGQFQTWERCHSARGQKYPAWIKSKDCCMVLESVHFLVFYFKWYQWLPRGEIFCWKIWSKTTTDNLNCCLFRQAHILKEFFFFLESYLNSNIIITPLGMHKQIGVPFLWLCSLCDFGTRCNW